MAVHSLRSSAVLICRYVFQRKIVNAKKVTSMCVWCPHFRIKCEDISDSKYQRRRKPKSRKTCKEPCLYIWLSQSTEHLIISKLNGKHNLIDFVEKSLKIKIQSQNKCCKSRIFPGLFIPENPYVIYKYHQEFLKAHKLLAGNYIES